MGVPGEIDNSYRHIWFYLMNRCVLSKIKTFYETNKVLCSRANTFCQHIWFRLAIHIFISETGCSHFFKMFIDTHGVAL